MQHISLIDRWGVNDQKGRLSGVPGSTAAILQCSTKWSSSSILAHRPIRSSSPMAARPTTPPILQGPTDKEKRYDRQLRLWAASGQQALEDAHVLLLNSGPGVVGIEALKNLILPGIGSFTIVDENKVREEDLGVNFFLTEESLGRSRAEESGNYLKELNPEVTGYAIQEVVAFLNS